MNKSLIVMCNGPSLKEIDFKDLEAQDVIGMNGAYRFFYKNNFWPKYFGCFDTRVTENHAEAYAKLIEESPIERFFLLKRVSESEKLTVLKLNGGIGNFSKNFETFGYGGNTGANCCQVGICLGYKKIILIGADCNYKEVVDGAVQDGGGLVMAKTPDENPNYFFDSYQMEGDSYNYPQASTFHQPAWNSLAVFAKYCGVDIVNCTTSSLTCFRKSSLKDEVQ